jgi:hypothetical protein
MEIVAIASAAKLELFMLIASGVSLGGIAVGTFFWAIQRVGQDYPNATRGTAISLLASVVLQTVLLALGALAGMQHPDVREQAIKDGREFYFGGQEASDQVIEYWPSRPDDGDKPAAPEGVSPDKWSELWRHMTPEERALFE